MLHHNIKSATTFQPQPPTSAFGDILAAKLRDRSLPRNASVDAVAFLKKLDAHGRHNLVAIDPAEQAPIEGRTFNPGDWISIAQWVDARAGRRNLYFTVNEPKETASHQKLAKDDVSAIRALYVDIDPAPPPPHADPVQYHDAERVRLMEQVIEMRGMSPAPSMIIDSGGGVQAFWFLDQKHPASERKDFEDAGRGLARSVGGDNVQNIDRIMRLPGAPNIPTAKKQAKGQIASRRVAVLHDDGARYSFEAFRSFAEAWPDRASPDKEPEIERLMKDLDLGAICAADNLTALTPELRQRFDQARAALEELDTLWASGQPKGRDKSSSAARFELAGLLKAWGFTPDEFGTLLCVWEFADKGGENFAARDDYDLRREIARAWTRSPDRAERFLEDLGEGDESATVQADDNWPDPIDMFGEDDPLELGTPPAGSLPSIIERWSTSEARRKGVPPAFAAAAAVTVCAAAIGNSLTIRPRRHDDGWTEPAGFWMALVAEPGRAKSPTIKAAARPLRELDKKRWADNKPRHDAWVARDRKRGKNAPDAGPEPRSPRSLIDDVTIEEQVRLHAANPRGLLRAPDELVSLFGSLGAYKNGPDGDRGQMLRMFDGDEIIVDRVRSSSVRAESALMSVIASTQPDKIGKLVHDLSGDGMLQRIIFIVDDGVRRRGVDELPDRRAVEDYDQMVRHFAEAGYPASDGQVVLSDAAYDVVMKATEHIEALADIPGATPAWKGHVHKWGKLLPRLVLVFHAIEHWELLGCVDPGLPVDRGTAEKAVLFARFLLRHGLRFFETYSRRSEATGEARWIAGHILTRDHVRSYARRDIVRARSNLQDSRALLAAMAELESVGWVTVAARKGDGPTHWNVNPKIHSRFRAHAERETAERAERQKRIKMAGAARKDWLASDNLSETMQGN